MAPLVISLTSLPSRAAHLAATAGTGLRTIATRASSGTTSTGGSIGGIFGSVFAFGQSIVSKAFSLVVGTGLSFVSLFQGLVRAFNFVWNFNWSVTDQALNDQIKGSQLALASSLGGTLGNAMGYLVCGAIPTALIATVNEPLAVAILLELGPNALDEIAGNVANLVTLTAKSIFQTAVIGIYKNIRSVLRPDGAKLKQQLIAQGKLTPEQISKAVAERDKPWSFAIATEEAIEAISNPFLEAAVENFVDEFGESCIEAGYILASTMDSQLSTFFSGFNAVLGGTTTVSIVP